MKRFTINQLSHLSGLPDQTILYWHKKFNVFPNIKPTKDPQFKYDSSHLNRLLNIATLFNLDKKYALEKICVLDDEELMIKVEIELMKNLISNSLNEDVINQLILSCITFNEKKFNLIINSALKKLNIKDFYSLIIYPFLLRIYDMFQGEGDKPVQFYYMINLLKRKLYHLIDIEPSVENDNLKVLLFLPENESNEIGILFAKLILKQLGFNTFYIGCNHSERTVMQSIEDIQPTMIITYLPTRENLISYKKTIEYLDEYIENFIILATPKNINSIKNNNCIKISTIEEFYSLLDKYKNIKSES